MNDQDFQDKTITCRECQNTFLFDAGEQKFFANQGYTQPTRCRPCRQARKAQKQMDQAGGMNSTGGYSSGSQPVYGEPPPQKGGRRNVGGNRRGRGGYDD